MKRHWINQYLLMQCLILTVTGNSYYTINAPGVLKSNRKYSVLATLHEATEPCTIRVAIEGPSFNETQDINLKAYESKVIEFRPNKLSTGSYKLKVEGLKGLSFKNESFLFEDENNGPNILIQTDRVFYKAQDWVNFRVAILDEHTRPLRLEDPVDVEILDESDLRVKHFKNITLINGVYTGKFRLSKHPSEGTWQIKVALRGRYDYSKLKIIQIRNYILPKFSVHLKTPTNIVLDDGYIKVVIFGKYLFDKYVTGNATIELFTNTTRRPLQSKQVDVEKVGFVEFNIKNEKDLENYNSLMVKAKLSEKYTGKTASERKVIKIQRQRFQLEIPDDKIEFENNKPYLLRVNVKHWTGAKVLDHKTPVIMQHGNRSYEAFLDANGTATFKFEHDANDDHKFQFKDSTGELSNIYTSENLRLNSREYYCRLKLLDENLQLGKPVLIEVSSIVEIPYLMYTLMGHASLIQTEYIQVPTNQKSFTISFTASIKMIPRSYIYVYYVHEGDLRYEEMTLNFPFENQISLSAPKRVNPGEDVTISINAQPKSYVSLMAVDLSVYLLENSYDLKKQEILDALNGEVSYIHRRATVYPGLLSGLLTLTNAHYPYESTIPISTAKGFVPTKYRFRERFPETWIFDNYLINETTTKLTLPIPDSITTWRVTAFSNNNETGFGIVDKPSDITSIKTFFISLNLPYSVKCGEIVSIPITIFNYHKQDLETEVVLYNNDQEFWFMESEVQGLEKSKEDLLQLQHITIPAENVRTINFVISPIKSGDIGLRVTASSLMYSDAVIQQLKVEPEGITKQNNQVSYFSIPKGEKISSSYNIKEPENKVSDSDYITFSVGGHYLVPTIENFDDLIRIPSGTGEENMVNCAPSVLILQYLKLNDKLSKEKSLVESLLTSLEDVYQQQLSYRHLDGGYSVFGMEVDEEPSTWLTAYVVRYFIKASEFLDIEEQVIESALEYLAEQQQLNGEFPSTGYLTNPNYRNEYGLTAFVLLAFLEDQKYSSKYQQNIQNGLEFLNSNLNNTDDLYVLALMTNALTAAEHKNAHNFIDQLKSRSKEENGLKWWSGNDQNVANDIEITAYAAQSLLDTAGDHIPILKWLIQKRNANGGFTCSFDTVVGMEALVKFSEKYKKLQNVDLKISYKAKNQEGKEVANDVIHIDSSNILDFQRHELPTTTRQVTFEIEGHGTLLVQLNHQYNIKSEEKFRHFKINTQPLIKNPEELVLNICFTYQADSENLNEVTNMIIMEVNLPSGYRSEAESNKSLKENSLVQKIESKNLETTVVLYLDMLEANSEHCLEIPAYKTNEIMSMKSAAVLMYDYYNLTRSNTEFYKL